MYMSKLVASAKLLSQTHDFGWKSVNLASKNNKQANK